VIGHFAGNSVGEGALAFTNSVWCGRETVPEFNRERASVTESTTEARAGSTPHMTRYVLTVGLILVIVIFAVIVLVGRS
jgi:hypothetical protein